MAGDTESESLARYILARCAVTRFAEAVFVRNLYRHGVLSLPKELIVQQKAKPGWQFGQLLWTRIYKWQSPEDDVRQVVRLDEFQLIPEVCDTTLHIRTIIPFQNMVPELGRFFRHHARRDCVRFIRAMDKMPTWYKACVEDMFVREQSFELPECSYQMFPAKLWIEGVPAQRMLHYLDIPWTRLGDYYYLHKLSELLKAGRGAKWTKHY